MRWLILGAIIAGFSAAAVAAQQTGLDIKPSAPASPELSSLENRVKQLEATVRRLSLNQERMQMADKNAVVNYDYGNGFSIIRFYQLEPFAGKLKECVVLQPTEAVNSKNEGPTCKLTLERKSDGKILTVENFKTLPGSKAKIDLMIKQDSCTFPRDIWQLRHSALYD